MNNKKFTGKKLLVLGSNVGAIDIVTYAKDNGAYTIVADYYQEEYSPAKRIADEAVMISTDDIDSLSVLIEERKIDGVLAGISEFNLLKAMKLCEKFNLPFYCTKKQWNMIEKKNEFRKLCEKYAVPCPKTYYIGSMMDEKEWEKIQYPAVIKPVDASSSLGVFICGNKEEMEGHIEEALSASQCGEIIIEEFALGDEFSAHYTIANGNVTLSCVDNRYPEAVHEGQVTTIPIARIFPCVFLDEYIKQVNPAMIELCRNIGINDGILFIQGLYNIQKNCFYIFEAGLRCAGEAPYRFISKINGINSMNVLVDHALSVKSDFDSKKEDPKMKGKCCGIVSFVTRGGIVGKIEGLEEAVKMTPSVIQYESRYPVGKQTPSGNTLRQLMLRFVMICNNREEMAKDIEYLNNAITVLDDRGKNMVIKMKPERIFDTK